MDDEKQKAWNELLRVSQELRALQHRLEQLVSTFLYLLEEDD